jgi:hypothetical protein
MSDIYDELGPTGDFIRFETPGDSITGNVTSLGIHTWEDGSKSLQLGLDIGGEAKVLTAGQVGLAMRLRELRPQVGDTVTVTYKGTEKRSGGKTLKLWDVAVAKGTGAAAPF